MVKIRPWTKIFFLCVFCAPAAISSHALDDCSASAPCFKTLINFDATKGFHPSISLVQGTDGSFYGTTEGGPGIPGGGTVFNITPEGKLTTLHRLHVTVGTEATLVLATDGNFYGTTAAGGSSNACGSGCGTIFKITPQGKLTTLLSFDLTHGASPNALVQGTDGNFYGSTRLGGSSGWGTIFKITPQAKLTTLLSFDLTHGASPNALVQGTDGSFYGSTRLGGSGKACSVGGCGTIFKITPEGTLTTLHNFDDIDGAAPNVLVQGTDGNFYGTTEGGPLITYHGTVFKITPEGRLTTLHKFDRLDGSDPRATLVLATDGNFYGTTFTAGVPGLYGTIFKITPRGKLTTLHSFDGADGSAIEGELVQGTNGTLYGTTIEGGTSKACPSGVDGGCGTVFSLSVGFGPFVETLPTSAKEGATVIILGTDLTDATKVNFNGAEAEFRVLSSTEITTKVPADAKTGTVEVTTPSSTLTSNVAFRVTPTIATRPSQSVAAFVVAPNTPDVSLLPHTLDDLVCERASVGCSCYPRQATLRNLEGLNPQSSQMISMPKAFWQTNNCPKTLEEGKFCTINVELNREFSGGRGELLVRIEDLGSPLTVALSGSNSCGY
ncbi:MAG TPA: choice-of-anchor tandem repeat GloVer-containing protein [Terriglobales bacterium]|nr:choice-of-anchor tandem repeat GloVer-containing protein [Terriglobales bacterium]